MAYRCVGMKRWPTRIVVFLLLGAITTVAVAWGSAALVHVPFVGYLVRGYSDSHDVAWDVRRFRAVGALHIESSRRRYTGNSPSLLVAVDKAPGELVPRWSNLETARGEFDLGITDVEFRAVEARGFPMLALRLEWQVTPNRIVTGVTGGVEIMPPPHAPGDPWPYPVCLPLRPIWLGFLIDTIIYSMVWMALLQLKRFYQSTIRLESGLCPHCAYRLYGGTEKGCPECGWQRETPPPISS